MKLVWLSHVLDSLTPIYGELKEGVSFQPKHSITGGDSCNVTSLLFSSHTGTHVDAPFHFYLDGTTIDQYPAEAFTFNSPYILNIETRQGQLIKSGQIKNHNVPDNLLPDIILIRTGFEQYRNSDVYWKSSPGLSGDFAHQLIGHFPSVRAIGIDCISISSLLHRNEGREAHRMFLGHGVLLLEDLSLSGIEMKDALKKVQAFPLRVKGGDGAPCTIVGFVE